MSLMSSARNLVTRSQELPKITSKFFLKKTCREFLAELIGTFCLIVVGNAAVATYLLRSRETPADTMAICFSFGVGALIGISASSKISGAHINPAVTVALACVKKFEWKKVWYYLIAQYLGAFIACGFIYLTFIDGIKEFDGGIRSAYGNKNSTGSIFATYPAISNTIFGSFIDQVIGTGLLMFAILSVTEEKGINVPKEYAPTVLALIITALCTAFNYNCGAILNPARDLAPRFFTAIAGWGWETFQPLGGHYWWVAGVAGPHIGAIFGAWVFLLTIDDSIIKLDDEEENTDNKINNRKDKQIEQIKETRLSLNDKTNQINETH